MQRVEIIANGKVQKVGYRDIVEEIAVDLDLKGFVENLRPYDVKIVAEGGEKNINEFIEAIKIKKYPVFVKEIEVIYKQPTNEFGWFEIKRGKQEDELGERLDVAGKLLYKAAELLEKRDIIIGKQDTTIGILRDIKKDTSDIKQDTKHIPIMLGEMQNLKIKY